MLVLQTINEGRSFGAFILIVSKNGRMIIIHNYILDYKGGKIFFVKSRDEQISCPKCGGILYYRDSRQRIRKKDGGEKQILIIRRLRCQSCKTLHNELPDCLVPYKHCNEYSCVVAIVSADVVILISGFARQNSKGSFSG